MATDSVGRMSDVFMRFAPRFCASVEYYAAMASVPKVWLDASLRYDKRDKEAHRMRIADTRGPLDLTVPVVKPHTVSRLERPLQWADVALSAHGDWWNVHRVTLESAYGRTPYFEFYIDRFLPFLCHPSKMPEGIESVMDLDLAYDAIIRELLLIDSEVVTTPPSESNVIDSASLISSIDLKPYYQVRETRFGFIPGLSVLDLIFNMGPEAAVYLRSLKSNIV